MQLHFSSLQKLGSYVAPFPPPPFILLLSHIYIIHKHYKPATQLYDYCSCLLNQIGEITYKQKTHLCCLYSYMCVTFVKVLFLYVNLSYYLVSSHFSLKIPFNIYCRADLRVTGSLSRCLPGNVLISPLFLKVSFSGYKF